MLEITWMRVQVSLSQYQREVDEVSRLKRIEQETILLFNEDEPVVHIETFNKQLKKRLATLLKKHPEIYVKTAESKKNGSVAYEMPVENVSISFRDEISQKMP